MAYLESLRVFCRVVELGSITAGGRDLRLTPALASKRIKELEKQLGVRLFNRTTRSLTPTEVGQQFYIEAQRILEAVLDAETVVAQYSDTPRGTIRMTAPLAVGRDWRGVIPAGRYVPERTTKAAGFSPATFQNLIFKAG